MTDKRRPIYLLLFVLALVVNFAGINADFFADDPGLYASIAKLIAQKNDWLQLYTYQTDWLDKPHFPFWMAALSFKLFGVSAWAYRLPALFFFMLGVGYTWLFARRFYTKEIAALAVLILMTAQHIIISNIDVRAEPYLMALVIGSIYHIARYNTKGTAKHLLLAALLTACAIMTKGIFVIVAIYGALLGQMIAQKKYLEVLKPKWLLLYLLTLLFTLPEFYALYIQFDQHPEKVVFGRTGVSGVRWFLWDSQFGRFVNNGPIRQKKSGDVFFFAHTMIWTFMPWCLLFYYAIYSNLKNLVRKIKLPEHYTLSGGLLLLLLFSLSRFQLPFYTNIIFPLFAVITANYAIAPLGKAAGKYRTIVLGLFMVALPLVIIVIHLLAAPGSNFLFITGTLIFGITAILIITRLKEQSLRVFMLTCCMALFANFYMNTVFFPFLASYNAQVTAARYANSNFKGTDLYSLRLSNNSFQFYSNRPVQYISLDDFKRFVPQGRALFYASQASVDYLRQQGAAFKIVQTFTDYPQENILPKFINAKTREQVLSKAYLISK
ncbi:MULTISPECIES: ArnT family glycosyltransferase [unclassified Mucilaginibacter]|uniref:ArnT family glycosyltransferase n=1 Tax=unclassified Mucilaginibacter TaxID=2617802 RepID=UPI000958FE78|nr:MULTISPECIES: glycosyltransferase family 39 protein [unclassified Mucilaginibacter]OJW15263.1 MAG: hypothetical protein BGO48_14125 [Mucilaginibacter sp. 44-25]PLW88391.1 MAG: glycosyl transferase [Mucilaginibacter sp.]HEK21723.1 glycosyltransferase family 39 protein [Bacteroidota bacterium]